MVNRIYHVWGIDIDLSKLCGILMFRGEYDLMHGGRHGITVELLFTDQFRGYNHIIKPIKGTEVVYKDNWPYMLPDKTFSCDIKTTFFYKRVMSEYMELKKTWEEYKVCA